MNTFHRPEVRELADVCAAWTARRDLRLHLDDDLHTWAATVFTAMGPDGVNPTFDPARSRITPGSAFHLQVTDALGDVIACGAGRLFVTDDFAPLIGSLGLWFDPVPEGMSAGTTPDLPTLSGRIGHVGGLWVHPRLRGSGLSLMLARLIRAVALDRFDAGWDTWITFRRGTGSAYGTATTVLCVDGFFPPRNRPEQVFLSYATAAQVLGVVRETVDLLRDDLYTVV
ncbi:GNAT family N-acetyltransferase [Herbidospora sp. RD11066]